MQKMVAITLSDILKGKQEEYELLAASSSLKTPDSFTLRAGELARFMIDEIVAGEFAEKAPFLCSE